MDIDVRIDGESLTLHIEKPHRFDLEEVVQKVIDFGDKSGTDLTPLKIEGLIPRMIRGVAGCEGGCPSNAMGLARQGFGDFKLSYIEGGILSAECTIENGKTLSVKIFPDFN
jgi:hypothetical protein